MNRYKTNLRAATYIPTICLLAFLMTGCFGTSLELPIYSVSGRVTEENDPDIGVPGVKLKFGLLGTTTTVNGRLRIPIFGHEKSPRKE